MMTPNELADQLTRRLDGLHDDEHTVGAAHLAVEAVRFLNYATGSHASHGLRYPATVYQVAADLSAAAARLPQLCRQLSGWLHDQELAGRLGNDDGTDPAVTVGAAVALLDDAERLAGRLGEQFAALQSAISGLHARGCPVRLCILTGAVAAIARTRVTALPGWAVPLPVLILLGELAACSAFASRVIGQAGRQRSGPASEPAGGSS